MTFLSYPVLDIRTWHQAARRFNTGLVGIPNATGLRGIRQRKALPDMGWDVGMALKTRAELQAFKDFISPLKGRWKPFWLPTWTADIVPTQTGSTTQAIARAYSYEALNDDMDVPVARRRYIGFWDGNSLAPRTITQVTRVDDEEYISFTGAVGADVDVGVFDTICYLNFVRLASDDIQIEYDDADVARCAFTAINISVDFAS